MRKALIILVVIFFSSSFIPISYASPSLMPEFLCELGLKFYHQGRYDEALQEFKKALMIKPNYQPALKYIQMIEQMGLVREEKMVVEKEIIPSTFKPVASTPPGAIKEMMDFIEIEREMIEHRQLVQPHIVPVLPSRVLEVTAVEVAPVKKPKAPTMTLNLDESLAKVLQSINIEQESSIIVRGHNIQRFLVTQPNVLTAEKKSPDELLVTAREFGYTNLHVWDDNGRWTTEFLTVPPKPEGPTYEEMLRITGEMPGTFKLRYSMDWSSYETGDSIKNLERNYYSYTHWLGLNGETPYGVLDSSASVRSLRTTTDLTYFTLGLREGRIGPLKDFSLRTFDYSTGISNLAFPGASLRGVMYESRAFNKKIDYTIFWGREGGGRYGGLSPGEAKMKHSFLGGLDMDWTVSKRQNYGFSVIHGWGRDRESFLNPYSYDLDMDWNFNKIKLGYEAGYDLESFAHMMDLNYTIPKLSLAAQLRDVSKKYLNISGWGGQLGELGGLLSLSYTPTEKLNMNTMLNVFQDRIYPAIDNDNRWNEHFNWDATYTIDQLTNLRLGYGLRNELGRISQSRSQNYGVGLSRKFKLIRDIGTFANYRHQEGKSFPSSSSDIINDSVSGGLRFNLIGNLTYYINKELNWLEERYAADRTKPAVLESGVDWNGQILNKPLYGNFRFSYRDEEDTISNLSFLSGQDYIEGYAELSYRPSPEREVYTSGRVRNIWADNPNVTKCIEVSFDAGMRYLWDTGVRWESVGDIEGYVFKDFNSDGLRQRDEPPVEGIKLWVGKDKSQVTDLFGYYRFKGARARRAYVTLDTSTLPSGFVLTVPVIQEVAIAHHATSRIDFGIISRSEISGLVFEDVDGNGEYSRDDKGVKGLVILLDDGKKTVTDSVGRYSFPQAPVGERTVTLDLNTLPVYYLPKTAITKKITLFEGVTHIYNIPLRRIEQD